MHITDVMKARPAGLEPNRPSTGIGARDLAWFFVFFLLGSLVVLDPWVTFAFLAAVVTLGLGWLALTYRRRPGLEVWQMLVLIGLTGYMVLNYGFENLTIHLGGVPIIVGYGVMYAALALAIFSRRHSVVNALKEPVMLCLAALLALTFLHLIFDIPSYGIWAVRDASLFLDGIFLILGLLWASKKGSTAPLLKGLFFIFLLNLLYAYTYPWNEQIQRWSPASGVFVRVPILGRYQSTSLVLLAGALFCLGLGTYVVRWPRWTLIFLAGAQLFGLGIHQYRAAYLCIALILILLMLLGELRKSAILFVTVSAAFAVLVAITSLGITITGRFGEVKPEFFKEHIRSLSGAPGTPGSAIDARIDWYDQVFARIRSNILIGEGFGEPLTNEINNENGSAIRQPHNSHISVLARLGVLGFAVWLLFHFCIVKRYIHVLRARQARDPKEYEAVLWFFLFYVMLLIATSVQPGIEFPTGSVMFYFSTGFAVGFMRGSMQREVLENHGREAQLLHAW